ncbi:hypothetical protein BDF20DRAFT_718744 [Mycotypha africana]|uniref:uncharacterized protein n=1 Tax=Mycotypha africana TaxID=64632 RepID=UPI0022FFE1B1|nr:uncharacterized protein BDF20DRAFT_718744 [Mycotypha africana]KAI8972062.1 hypothetical protein BDF20DRAFT_718744 [Mycotypha africana]
MSGLVTLAIGAIFKVEKLTIVKVISVCVSFAGVVLVSYSDQTTEQDGRAKNSAALIGDMLALSGAVFYGCYTTLLKLKIDDESRIDMPLFFGYVGTFNILLMWPIFPLLHFLGIEKFDFPSSAKLWVMVLSNAFIGTFLSDYLWLLAMLMTSPLVVTLGISLTIPMALIGDVVFKHFLVGFQYAIGAILVVVSFLIVNIATLNDVKQATAAENYVADVNEEETDIRIGPENMANTLSNAGRGYMHRAPSRNSILNIHRCFDLIL